MSASQCWDVSRAGGRSVKYSPQRSVSHNDNDGPKMELSSEDELDSVDLPADSMKHRCSSLTIYPLDYKYSLASTYPQNCPRFINVPHVLVMVGLPARGKTYMAKKLCRYLNWIGVVSKVFNVGEYRRKAVGLDRLHEFFKHDNREAQEIRKKCAMHCLEDVSGWLDKEGQVAIFDATNTTRDRRRMVLEFCCCRGFKVLFIESICDDEDLVSANIKDVKVFSPDYDKVDKEKAYNDFKERIKHYEEAYETLSLEYEGDLSFIKIINAGEQYSVNNVDGYLQSRAVYFLMNIHATKRSIYLTRNGEGLFNVQGRLGGQSELTTRGEEFAFALSQFVEEQNIPDLKVWTSQLSVASHTAKYIDCAPVEQWKALDELDYGLFDGKTPEEIEEISPEHYKAWMQDKFSYRFPKGESYNDVISRLEPVIMELERLKNVLVVCHKAVMQCLMAYFLDKSSDQVANLGVPLHTVFKLTPIAYGCRVERFPLFVSTPSTSPNRKSDNFRHLAQVFNRVLLERMRAAVDANLREEQADFPLPQTDRVQIKLPH